MKKILSILGAIGLAATTGATVVACQKKAEEKTEEVKEIDLNDFTKPETINAFNVDNPTAQEILDDINKANGTDLKLTEDVNITIEKNEEGKFTATIEAVETSNKIKGEVKTIKLEFNKVEKREDWTGDNISGLKHQWDLSDYNAPGRAKIWIKKTQIKESKVDFSDKELSSMLWKNVLNAKDGKHAQKDFDEKALEKHLHFTGDVNKILNDIIPEIDLENKETNKEITVDIAPEIAEKLGIKLDKDLITYTTLGKEEPEACGLKAGETQFENGLILKIILEIKSN